MDKIIFNSSQKDIEKMTQLMEKARETVREKEKKVKKDMEEMNRHSERIYSQLGSLESGMEIMRRK